MAIELIWWADEATLEFRCSGDVVGEEFLARKIQALADPRFSRIRRQLCDLSAVNELRVPPDQVRRIVGVDADAEELAPGMAHLALVVEAGGTCGFGGAYRTALDGRLPTWEVEALSTRGEALDWLGVDEAGQNDAVIPPARRA